MLSLRIKAILGRVQPTISAPMSTEPLTGPPSNAVFGGCVLDPVERTVTFPDETRETLSDSEFRLLFELVNLAINRPGEAYGRDKLYEKIFHRAYQQDDRGALDNLVSRVRSKLNSHGRDQINTLRDRGYLLNAAAHWAPRSDMQAATPPSDTEIQDNTLLTTD